MLDQASVGETAETLSEVTVQAKGPMSAEETVEETDG